MFLDPNVICNTVYGIIVIYNIRNVNIKTNVNKSHHSALLTESIKT